MIASAELVDRIWARDPTVWTGGDEARWLGWLDEPLRMLERVDELLEVGVTVDADDFVLLGMGGSSLAAEVLRRAFAADRFHVLDTTHPRAIARLESELDLERTLFIAASKSGTTLETRAQLDHFWERTGGHWDRFVAITDPGTPLEELARERGFQHVFPGEPTIGGRYSALSVFGLVPAALMGIDVRRLLERAEEMRDACRLEDGNPGLELGLGLGEAWRQGYDKVKVGGDFGLWIEQLLAESTGKAGKGLVPVRYGDDAQEPDVRIENAYELGQEFFRWEFATAVAGSIIGINPFDQPDVQAAKDRTNAILGRGGEPTLEPEGDLEELLADTGDDDYVAILAFIDPVREPELEPVVERARATGRPVAVGLGPRYLHSTGQLHKGGPPSGVFVQVVDDFGDDLPEFRRLIAAQAAGDYEALAERGRRICRVAI